MVLVTRPAAGLEGRLVQYVLRGGRVVALRPLALAPDVHVREIAVDLPLEGSACFRVKGGRRLIPYGGPFRLAARNSPRRRARTASA